MTITLPVLSNHLMFWYSFDGHALIILRTGVVGQVHMLKFVEWMVLHVNKKFKKNKKRTGKKKKINMNSQRKVSDKKFLF